ncbi:UNVERIFIED_CONTAM: putative inactive receptor kinase [Sesamum radiatum]|uniref:Inactive receptor kinase n=1 Tax=Sesamum radiatum TaxID=300843 RepID=A0AAW2QEE0_SESRA
MSSFALNSRLCGEIIHKECPSTRPFFGQPTTTAPPTSAAALRQTAGLRDDVALSSKGIMQKHRRAALVIGFSLGVSIVVISLICFAFAVRKHKRSPKGESTKMGLDPSVTGNAEAVMRIAEENEELEEKVKRVQEGKQLQTAGKSGSLVFCAGEAQVYSLDQLMRASAELLGKGTMGARTRQYLTAV